ncbi:MAG: Co2+/Mg2+ efflux protein ApaG [Saprospiraceae bacterium]|nr:Co2+/Mg2+ efflux protein ApaG [Saprospiraceae bacterium]
METQITNGIKITVDPHFEPLHSNPVENKYLYSYHIEIENLSEYTVQLLSRHWIIFDSVGIKREVKGSGVIGQQPILHPGQVHEYSSWCPLSTAIGKMHGFFTMQRLDSNLNFEVEIPAFDLLAPSKLN